MKMTASEQESVEAMPEKLDDSAGEDIFKLVALGKREIVCRQYSKAVDYLHEACGKLVEKYGEEAEECAEAYVSYGKALFELSKMERSVLENALVGLKQDEEEEEEEEECTDEDNEQITEASTNGHVENGDTNGVNGTEEEMEEGEEDEQATTEEEADSSQEEEVSNLQLAWEVLEVAKNIYTKNVSKENKEKLVSVLENLADIGIESGQVETAIGDLKQCIELQKEILKPHDRRVAESYYKLALAYHTFSKYPEALEALDDSRKILKLKIEHVTKKLEQRKEEKERRAKLADENAKEDARIEQKIKKWEKELTQINSVLPDLQSKIDEIEEDQKTEDVDRQMIKDSIASTLGIAVASTSSADGAIPSTSSASVPGPSTSSTDAPGPSTSASDIARPSTSSSTSEASTSKSSVSDITHLVRKKRKPEEEPVADKEEKKSKTEPNADEETVNGKTAVENSKPKDTPAVGV